MQRMTEGEAIRFLRLEAGLTQTDLAKALGQPQSFVSKIESGERTLHVSDLELFSHYLGCNVTTILNRITGLNSVLDRWMLSESELTELIDDIKSTKDDDHDRKKKGDRRLFYKGAELIVEVKSLQTNTVKYNAATDLWTGKSQVDGSDRRTVLFDDGSKLDTTLLIKGDFDILAVNCFAFGNTWRFAFALNNDLAMSTYSKYSEEQRRHLIASLQTVTWPPEDPFTSDFNDVLERAWRLKQVTPDVRSIKGS